MRNDNTDVLAMGRVEYEVNGTQIKLTSTIVKKYLVSGDPTRVTDEEVGVFLQLCKGQKLNPFLREAYLVKFGNKPAAMIVGKDTFTKRELRNQDSEGHEAGIIVVNLKKEVEQRSGTFYLKGEEKLVGGWAKAYRKNKKFPTEITVTLDEYIGKKADGTINSNWTQRPATMIRKVALVQALREAYPEEFEGLYVAEEMNVDDKDLNTEPVDPEKEIEKENEVPEQPKPVQREQKEYLMQLGAQKGLVIGEGKEADVSKLEALANEHKISLRGLTYESANTLLKLVEEYTEVVDVEVTPVNDDPGPDAPPDDIDDADPF
ncbi:phage recombination protein Bet [Clostridium pasteurianum]|uniref:Phage recombination protein Bet n=1 Tax=Clostridium pasteurianum BC1 TaxID=86416 RepID=R4KBH4_CLOPA|nr:phage recombination protein Bet [Clostridium pasteurianum]AGK99026.1 phage recombination protein Bet [Clostridium pasteurianum BC1]